MDGAPCSVDGCENDARKAGLCWGHLKRQQRGQVVSTALEKRPQSPMERLTEAALAYAEADGDEEFGRARDNLRKAAAACAPAVRSEVIRSALALLKSKGVQLGRPRKADPAAIARALAEVGKDSTAALMVGVSRWTIQRWRRKTGAQT